MGFFSRKDKKVIPVEEYDRTIAKEDVEAQRKILREMKKQNRKEQVAGATKMTGRAMDNLFRKMAVKPTSQKFANSRQFGMYPGMDGMYKKQEQKKINRQSIGSQSLDYTMGKPRRRSL